MTAIIFDLDGTLIDSAPDIHAAVTRMLSEEGAPALPFIQVRSFIGNGVPTLIDRVMAARGEPADPLRRADLIARFMQQYEAAATDLTTIYPGVHSALAALRTAGYPMGICTNKPVAAAQRILSAFGLDVYFQVLIGGDSLPERKPHPHPLLAIRNALGRTKALFIGDSEIDAATAVAAETAMILFTEGYRKSPISDLPHAASFADFAELPAIVHRLARA